MATVVNDRDLQLESISPRVAGVTLSANITVTQDQVDGLGLVLGNTKNVTLLATTQVIQVQHDGTTVPSSVTLTANIANLTETPTLTIVPGSGTMSVTPALTAGVFTFTPAQLTTDSISFKLSVVDAGTTYSDTITVMKVYQGSDGLSAILTNENVTLAADYLGNVLSYTNAGGAFKVYHGTDDVTSVCTFSIPTGGNPDSLTAAINASGGSAGLYAVTAGFPSGSDTTSVTLRATFGTTTIDKVFSLSKAKAGTPGSSGTGTAGQRGSVMLYVGLTGTTAVWSDSTANAAVVSNATTGPFRLDQVTEYNNSQGFSVTKVYDGTNWQTVNAVINGNLLVTGTVVGSALAANTVTSDKVDTRNLTIKDAAGNVIFSSGTVIGNDASTTLGFNPAFSNWTSTYPNNWAGWTGAAPVKNFSVVASGGVNSVQWTTNGSDQGMQTQYIAPSPLPAGTFITGSFSMYVVTNGGGGKPGYLVRLFTNAALTTYVDTIVPITDQTVSGWQKMPFTATANGAAIYSIQIYQMPSWGTMPGGNMGTGSVVVYGPFTFDVQTKIQYGVISPDSGWLNSNVTPSGIGAVGSGNPITSSNVSTYISSAAITYAQINYVNASQVNASSLSAITATIGTLQTATSGQRLVIKDNKIGVFDSGNALRVRIGDLTGTF